MVLLVLPPKVPDLARPEASIRGIWGLSLGQAQHLLGDEAQDQLLADRRDARDQHFAQEALDVVLLGVAEAAMRQPWRARRRRNRPRRARYLAALASAPQFSLPWS
jgi:hypothetical protein